MPHRKRKTREENPFLIAEQFAGIVDTLFVRYAGKTLGGLAVLTGNPAVINRGLVYFPVI